MRIGVTYHYIPSDLLYELYKEYSAKIKKYIYPNYYVNSSSLLNVPYYNYITQRDTYILLYIIKTK